MRTQAELEQLKETAEKQARTSGAKDYWLGIHDAIDWVLDGHQPAIDIWLEIANIKPGPGLGQNGPVIIEAQLPSMPGDAG